VLIALIVLSAAYIQAQSTPEATGESTTTASSFNDHRINGDIFLGGLAIYCQDQNGNTDTNTFQNGGLTIWGPDGQEFIFLNANQLRGNREIPQLATMEANMTETVAATATATLTASGTQEAQAPMLLARANTPNGPIWLFRTGNDQFELQGNDNTGKFFTYLWTGCSIGSLQAGAVPLFTPGPAARSTPMATVQATVETTTSP